MPGSATMTPTQVAVPSRSPRETPTNTGTSAAPTPAVARKGQPSRQHRKPTRELTGEGDGPR
jgi:hypothetical protein